MCAWFALGHGCAVTPLIFATSVLSGNAGFNGNAALYASTLVSALLIATPVTGSLGLPRSLALGMGCYVVYTCLFMMAALADDSAQSAIFVAGSVVAGLGASVLWTAQGAFFSAAAARVAGEAGAPRQSVSGDLAARFAFWYLSLEILTKLIFSGLMAFGLSVPSVAALYAALTGVSAAALARTPAIFSSEGCGNEAADVNNQSKLLAAVALWGNPMVWLISPINIMFGLSQAYVTGYILGEFATSEVGSASIGLLGAFTGLCAAALTPVYQAYADRYGKISAINLGAASLVCIPLCTQVLGCCNGWGWRMLVVFALQGSGRAAYESTNRALFSDYFPGPLAEGAFANQFAQASASAAVGFLMAEHGHTSQLLPRSILAIGIGIAPVFYMIAARYQKASQGESNPLI